MDHNKTTTNSIKTATLHTDVAMCVPVPKWFIAIVNNRSEKIASERLTKLDIDHYLPIQEETHLWKNGREVKVNRVMIPSKIFIRCTEAERRQIVKLPFIFRFMTNRSGIKTEAGTSPVAIVPDHEIEQLKFMLGVADSPVAFTDTLVKGQKVEVTRGPFRGLIGILLKDAEADTSRLYVNIDFLGSASVQIAPSDVTPIL